MGWPAALLLAGVLAACSADGGAGGGGEGGAAAELGALAGTQWRLAEGVPGAGLDGVEVTLAVGADGHVSGTGGCNSYRAAIAAERAEVRIGPAMATKRGCPGPRNRVEAAYFGALGQVHSLRREGDALLLVGEGVRLRFVAAAAPPG